MEGQALINQLLLWAILRHISTFGSLILLIMIIWTTPDLNSHPRSREMSVTTILCCVMIGFCNKVLYEIRVRKQTQSEGNVYGILFMWSMGWSCTQTMCSSAGGSISYRCLNQKLPFSIRLHLGRLQSERKDSTHSPVCNHQSAVKFLY